MFIPCSTVASIIEHFEQSEQLVSFPVSREEDGVGIAAGISLGGKTPILLIQDTGIGNSILAITTFVQAYHVPMLILVTRRGGFAEINSAVALGVSLTLEDKAIKKVISMKGMAVS